MCRHVDAGVLPSVACLSVILKPRHKGGLGALGAVEPWGWGGVGWGGGGET